MEITKIKEAKNIDISDKRIKSIIGTDFLLKFDVDCDFDKIGLSEFYFILDENIENNFNFSVYKDYENKTTTLCIEGNKDNRFSVFGYEGKDF